MSIASPDPVAAAPARPAVECRSIRKVFPGVTALDDVSVAVARGEIHALLGQNGAGKSTLVKILTGVYQPDAGRILVDGAEVRLRDVRDAEAKGIAIVHQDQQLVAQLDVTGNALLGNEIVRGGLLDRPAMRRRVQAALDRVQADFSPDVLVRDLSVAQRAQVAIAAALLRQPTALILDEPTASLSDKEAERLFEIVRALRDDGVTIIYISHYLDEVLSLVDRISVLRDGRLVATVPAGEISRADIVRMIVGREVSQLYPKESVPIGDALLEVRGLEGPALHGIDLTVRRGEILGIAGLVGAGRSELALTLVGALPRQGGTVSIGGRPSAPAGPRAAMAEGFALIPEDRRQEGLVIDLPVRENLTLPNVARWARFGLLDLGREAAAARELVARLGIQPPSIRTPARNLSGGNQQKVVVGRWLTGDSRVFLFDEPTTGVDVGSKIEIYRQMVELARSGAAVIFISSDFEEISAMCDRTVVMRRGRIAGVIEDQAAATPEALLDWASGSAGEAPARAGDAAAKAARQGPVATILSRWGTVAGMALTVAVIAALAPQFLAIGNIFDVLKQGSVLAFIALGLTVVLIAGGFDMSAGAASQFAANVAAGTLLAGFGSAAAIALGGVLGLAVGAVNAGLVLALRIPAFVATLGMMFVVMGATLLYNGGQALTLANRPDFFFLGQGYVGPVPFVFILLVAVTAALHVLLKETRLGLRMYAVGQNAAAALLRGVGRTRYAFASFALGGLVLGLAGVVLAAYSYGASALATGVDFLISALAATFLGSTMSRAGELNVVGTVVAAIFLASLSNGLILLGISNQALPGIQGMVLVLSVSLGLLRKRAIGQVLIF
ncbi:ATP-binding cassette domain-containing protein [Labrys wisconsinensis]|uniref:Ribose transport system ATP-binding protein n=1 Tax=Labrys wisconsinensis TaxID=425677 RepID=A0ABU0JNK1_9HYPH|nr:ATP-binding cassette domain-containing protein [Labrys wisconsinensis]MDQ0475215.1 ribose transport system ATP-binding protein [Labrys wisconsinensis]